MTLKQVLLVGLLALAGCQKTVLETPEPPLVLPVLLVHGLLGDATSLSKLQAHLAAQGVGPVKLVSLTPADGSASIEALAGQLDAAVASLQHETGAAKVDVVGYSMGALVARYWLQRLDGKARARRFVSLSGPHQGVVGGYLTQRKGGAEMRFHSPFIRALEADRDPWGPVEVFDFYSPWDLMIVPARFQALAGARLRLAFPVPTHHQMSVDPMVLAAVADVLRTGAVEREHLPDPRHAVIPAGVTDQSLPEQPPEGGWGDGGTEAHP
jgi:pimeloyl-ACP methyl ester carboxylesterase